MKKQEKHLQSKKYIIGKRIFLVIILIVATIIGVVVIKMNMTDDKALDDETLVTETVNNAFLALKKLNTNKVNKYLDYEDLVNSLDEMILEQRENELFNLEKKLFYSLEWNIESVSITNDSTAEVVVEATNKNFNNIIIEWINLLLELDANSVTSEIQIEKLEEAIDKITVTKTITRKVKLVKKDDIWTVKVNTDFRDLVFPGIDSIATVIEGNK